MRLPLWISRAAALAGLGLCLSMSLASVASAQRGGPPPGGRGGNTKTNGDMQQILNQWLNGVIQQEKTGVDRMNGFADFSQFNQHTAVWEDEQATSLSPSSPGDPGIAAATAAANMAAFKAMDQINQADLDNLQNINVDNFVGGSAAGVSDSGAEYAAMQDLVSQATADVSNGQIDPDLAGAADLSNGVQSVALAAIYAGYNIDANGLTVTSLDYHAPFPSDVMTSLDLQPALCGR
jgi:hypothetical protein